MSLELPGIFSAGILTFLSPCILPLVPLYLSLLGGVSVAELKAGTGEQASVRLRARLVLTALVFSLGLGLVFVAMGLAATQVGHALVAHRTLLLQLGGLVVFLFGLKFLGVLRLPFLEREARPWFQRLRTSGGLFGAFLFGAAFALGWTPCVGPVLGSVLTFTASSAASPWEGAAYLGAYAAGLSVPLVITAAVAPWALKLLERMRPQMRRFEVVTGILLLGAGLVLMTDSLERLTPSLDAAPMAAAADTPSDAAIAAVVDSAVVVPSAASAATGDEAVACGGEGAAAASGCELPEVSPDATVAPAETWVTKGPALLEFVSRSCPVCQRMAPIVAAAEHDCAGRNVAVRRVDVSDPAGAALARQFGVRGVPTFVFLDGAGEELARLVGEQPLKSLTQSIEVLAGEKCDGFRTLRNATGG